MAKYPPNIRPLGRNKQKAKFSFDQRSLYKNDLFLPEHQDNLIDFWYANQNYGKLNSDNECVFLLENNLKQINADKVILAVNFVADAFNDMVKELQVKLLSFDIPTKNTFLKDIKPISGWTSIHHRHHISMKALYSQLAKTFFNKKGHGKEVTDFNSFMYKFLQFYDQMGQATPITKTGFIKTKQVLPNMSGLIINLADEDCGDDIVKFYTYINDSAFNEYYNMAKKYGFYIDKNAPWRLVANIDSPMMKKYMRRYGIRTAQLYHQCYMRASDVDISTLQIYLIQFYNSYVKEFPVFQTRSVKNGNIVYKKKTRTEVNLDHIVESYGVKYWISLYAQIRNIEQGKPMNDQRRKAIVDIAAELEKQFDILDAIRYINIELYKATKHLIRSTQQASTTTTPESGGY